MLVAIIVYFASFFGYTITNAEFLQEEKDILLKPETYTFAPGAMSRQEEFGGSSITLSVGFEKQLTPLDRKWAFHTSYRFASEARSVADAIGNFQNRDHYLSFGMMRYVNDKVAIYFDAGPYWRRTDLKAAVTLGASFTMSAFGGGFWPNIYVDCLEGGCQFGLFANFEIF